MWPWLAKIASGAKKGRDLYKNNTSDRTRLKITTVLAVIILIFFALVFSRKLIAGARKYIHKDIRKIEYDSNNLSYDKSVYSSYCSTLEGAMNYSGTDEDSIFEVMRKMNNQDDWNFTIKTFGTRTKDGGTFGRNITGDLKLWIIDELYDDDRQEVRDILSRNNITF